MSTKGMMSEGPVWNGREKQHENSCTDLANVVEKIYELVQYQNGVLQRIEKDNIKTRQMMVDFINCFKPGVPRPVIPMNEVVVSRDESYSSNDSGISFENSSSEDLSPSLDSKLMSDEETEPIYEERTVALNRLAELASKEGNIIPSSADDEQRMLDSDQIGDQEMHTLETPISAKMLNEADQDTRTSAYGYEAEKSATLGQVPLPNEEAYSSMYGNYTTPDQRFYSMPRIDGNSVTDLFPGDGSNSNGIVSQDSGFSYGYNPVPLYPKAQNEQTITYSANGQTNAASTEYFMCEYCCKDFYNHHSLVLHSKACTSKTLPKSPAILKPENSSCISVEDSQNTNAQSLVPRNRSARVIPCKHCERTFPTQHQVTSHERVHTGARPFTCYVCDAKFAHGGNMIKHIKNKHPKSNPYRCRNCSETFKTYPEIQLHRKDQGCSSRDALSIDGSAADKLPPAITKISKSRRSGKKKRYSSVSKKRNSNDEDTDSSPESEDQQKTQPFAICPPAQSDNSNFSELKTETKPSTNLGPDSRTIHSGFGWRNDTRFLPKSSLMEQDANELLEYSNFNKTQIKTEPPSDFDSISGNFIQNPSRNASDADHVDLSKVKMEVLD